jgi:ElaB/YqjD/DUF883 family membrane-anchored ribosome-binding protein
MARQRGTARAAETAASIGDELQNLRNDFTQLATQVEELASATGGAAVDDLKRRLERFAGSVDEMISIATTRGKDAVGAVSGLGEDVMQDVEAKVRDRPFVSLAIAVGVGFVVSAMMRR